ncbi:MAG TPA: hypothetical protein PK677_06370 [Acidiphilium sp.]|nr:MAG: hypothetical protein B7Z67_10900 [Acidiphilium sp. 21-60-14]OYV90665.1 MAG: hypothetical protein B7Z57_08625 [Acidiphilium sp. 37-60-79]OZB38543.1 MAG: hypothetical protein B7X48_12560 [Acidiphilium sp. 34-60-192]HQT88164.1 hypothetical protein [Acidiphilium sp.]HQU24216.1 hypothetical protein [Acidiphilium sp.]
MPARSIRSRPDRPAPLAHITGLIAHIATAFITAFREKFGHYVHNGYGLTETNSPTHAVQLPREAPVDPASSALAIGVPVYNTASWLRDDAGNPLPLGETVKTVISLKPGTEITPEQIITLCKSRMAA